MMVIGRSESFCAAASCERRRRHPGAEHKSDRDDAVHAHVPASRCSAEISRALPAQRNETGPQRAGPYVLRKKVNGGQCPEPSALRADSNRNQVRFSVASM